MSWARKQFITAMINASPVEPTSRSVKPPTGKSQLSTAELLQQPIAISIAGAPVSALNQATVS